MNIFRIKYLPGPGEPFQYNYDVFRKMNTSVFERHSKEFKDCVYGGDINFRCKTEAMFINLRPNLRPALHDGWSDYMEKTQVTPRYIGKAYFTFSFTEDLLLDDGLVVVTWDLKTAPRREDVVRATPGGTTTMIQDESIGEYGLVPERVPYCCKCSDSSMELWVMPHYKKSRRGANSTKDDVVSMTLTVLGSSDGDVVWKDTTGRNYPVFRSQHRFIIGGSNAVLEENVIRLGTDTVADRHLEGRRRGDSWEIRPLDGIVYIDGTPVEAGSDWIRVEDAMVITLGETTISITCNG